MRRATGAISSGLVQRAISIHALHEESDLCSYPSPSAVAISIHALHEESDLGIRLTASSAPISIHALHEESDRLRHRLRGHDAYFNPRSP